MDYLWNSLLETGRFLGAVMLPLVVVGLMLQLVENLIARQAMRLWGGRFWLWLSAPGVMLHELGHVLFCVVFRHKIVDVAWFKPQPNGELGHVNHSFNRSSLYQRVGNFFIGIGPIILGTAVLAGIAVCCFPLDLPPVRWGAGEGLWHEAWQYGAEFSEANASRQMLASWQGWVGIVLFLIFGMHISLSFADMKGAFSGFLILAVGIFGMALLGGWMKPSLLALILGWLTPYCTAVLVVLVLVLAFQCVVFAGMLGLRLLFKR